MKNEQNKTRQKSTLFWVAGALCVLNFAAHLFLYSSLPELIPIHWNFQGEIDGWGPRWVDLVLSALPGLLLLLFRVLPAADPKAENYRRFGGFYQAFALVLSLFMIGISWMAPLQVLQVVHLEGRLPILLIEGGIGVMFILLGNYMPHVRQNYFMGVKTPWALADEHNWNRSQRMGGITFVVMGAVMLADGLLGGAVWFLSMGSVLVGVVWMYLYSFLVFKGIMK